MELCGEGKNSNHSNVGGGGNIAHTTKNLVKSARVCTIITLL